MNSKYDPKPNLDPMAFNVKDVGSPRGEQNNMLARTDVILFFRLFLYVGHMLRFSQPGKQQPYM